MSTHIGRFYNWPFSQDPTQDVFLQTEQFEFLEYFSENHSRSGNGWSGGGEFMSKKQFIRYNPSGRMRLLPSGKLMYDGAMYAAPPGSTGVSSGPLLDLKNFGPSVYRQAQPDTAVMDVGNAIYELKDVPSMLKDIFEATVTPTNLSVAMRKFSKDDLKPNSLSKISDFNLAVAFGWLPLLADCIGIYNLQRNLAKKIEQLKRDNGRPVRRRFEVKSESSKSDVSLLSSSDPYGTNLTPNFITQCYADGNWELSRHETTRMWFSGQFRSWLPDKGQMSDDEWTSMLKRRLMGLNPTPSRIYKAMPWSWLIDWFSNVGDNLANLNLVAADRQINDYAFLMRHYESFNRLTCLQRMRVGDGSIFEARAVTEQGLSVKERAIASPFGFGIKIPDLSPFQLTILGSLGGKSGKHVGFT